MKPHAGKRVASSCKPGGFSWLGCNTRVPLSLWWPLHKRLRRQDVLCGGDGDGEWCIPNVGMRRGRVLAVCLPVCLSFSRSVGRSVSQLVGRCYACQLVGWRPEHATRL